MSSRIQAFLIGHLQVFIPFLGLSLHSLRCCHSSEQHELTHQFPRQEIKGWKISIVLRRKIFTEASRLSPKYHCPKLGHLFTLRFEVVREGVLRKYVAFLSPCSGRQSYLVRKKSGKNVFWVSNKQCLPQDLTKTALRKSPYLLDPMTFSSFPGT